MLNMDLNLLVTLNVLLTEANITRAAQKQGMSVSAMSRALTRLRMALNDPLLVKSGRFMVLTPYAASVRTQVTQLIEQIEQVFKTPDTTDFIKLDQQFTLRASAGFAENSGALLLARMRQDAPAVTLRIISKEEKYGRGLKEGKLDAEISVVSNNTEQEMKSRLLFSDKMVGVVSKTHPLTQLPVTAESLQQYEFIGIDRQPPGDRTQPVCYMSESGMTIKPAVMLVSGFSAAVAIAAMSNLIAVVPEQFTANLRKSLFSFPLPFPAGGLNFSLLWHPRTDNDPVQKWFRECILQVCRGDE
ncbi:LysR family transcriptional regulator [Morganella psychrotolerans]|uniref:LysR family transcriptional regulator n=1 Tax=Morganella psychrotolerans TaxID=368603 RepID=UPI0039AF7471